MRHNIKQKKLNMTSNHRKALFKNLSRSIILHNGIVTTLAKAKAVRSIVEKLITKGRKYIKSNMIYHLRAIQDYIGEDARKVMLDKCQSINRNGGYTRIVKMSNRKGDNAKRAYIGLVD